jgi:serine/threonine protein phosphatase PrpC
VVDSEEGDLYVALTGDCRAVAGWEKDGLWRCDVLSEDQMGENESEVQRYVLLSLPFRLKKIREKRKNEKRKGS